MTEEELRALVRETVRQRLGERTAPEPAPFFRTHASHTQFALPRGADVGGPCLIEPTVPCNHCGYCKSYGH